MKALNDGRFMLAAVMQAGPVSGGITTQSMSEGPGWLKPIYDKTRFKPFNGRIKRGKRRGKRFAAQA